MYSEPNTIIKAAHIHVEGDPSKYTLFNVSQPHSLSSQTKDHQPRCSCLLENAFHFDRFSIIFALFLRHLLCALCSEPEVPISLSSYFLPYVLKLN